MGKILKYFTFLFFSTAVKREDKMSLVVNFFFFLRARLYSLALFIGRFTGYGKIDIAYISDIRDDKDARNTGFSLKKFRAMPWIMQIWTIDKRPIVGQIFVLGCKTVDVSDNKEQVKEYALEAIRLAVAKGAKVILFAANTKRLFELQTIQPMFPDVVFTLGDNLTANLLKEGIDRAFWNSRILDRYANVLVIAPYGLLGKVAFEHMVIKGCNKVFGLCNALSKQDIEGLILRLKRQVKKINNGMAKKVKFVTSFDQIDCKIDLIIACDRKKPFCDINTAIISKLKWPDKKLVIVDPCEPANLDPEVFAKNSDKILRYDAGNAYNKDIKHFVWGHKLLGMPKHTIFGCFAETLLLASDQGLLRSETDWFSVTQSKMAKIKLWDKFYLPRPTNYGKPIEDFAVWETP